MPVSFNSRVSFSDSFFEKKANLGESTALERLVQLVDSCCTFLQKTRAEVKAVSKDRELIYDRVPSRSSSLEKSIKLLLCLLIVPMIIILAMKLILRFALSIKYSGFIEDRAPSLRARTPTPPPTTPVMEKPKRPISDREIEGKYLTLSLSKEEDLRIQELGSKIFSGGETKESLKALGITVSADPSVKRRLEFSSTEFPGIVFQYVPGGLAYVFDTQIEETSLRKAVKVLAKIWEVGVKILRPILEKEGDITPERRDQILKEHAEEVPAPAVACIVEVSLASEVVAFLVVKDPRVG